MKTHPLLTRPRATALVMALAQAVQWPLHFELEHGCLVVRLGPWPALL